MQFSFLKLLSDLILPFSYNHVPSPQLVLPFGVSEIFLCCDIQPSLEMYNCNVHFSDMELVTPPLNGIILPGVTRQSLLDLARKWVSMQKCGVALPPMWGLHASY